MGLFEHNLFLVFFSQLKHFNFHKLKILIRFFAFFFFGLKFVFLPPDSISSNPREKVHAIISTSSHEEVPVILQAAVAIELTNIIHFVYLLCLRGLACWATGVSGFFGPHNSAEK